MMRLIQEKIKEYRRRFIEKPGYVVEVGSFDMNGGLRHLFEDADDFCGIDSHRGPGVDIVSEAKEIGRLFEFNPDTVIYVSNTLPDKHTPKTMRIMRELLIDGGFMIVTMPKTEGGSYLDLLFNGYDILDLCEIESTICAVARKPYTIRHDSQTNS